MTVNSSNTLRRLVILFILAPLVACQAVPTPVAPVLPATSIPIAPPLPITSRPLAPILPTASTQAVSTPTSETPIYRDASQPVEKRVADLLARMTLDEKIGQMIQIEHPFITPADVNKYFIGSVLTGGNGLSDNSPEAWRKLVEGYQAEALKTRLGIPLLYGVDATHGHAHIFGATIFPQEIGLGATRDTDLIEKISQTTAEEMVATSIRWNFAPYVAVPQDIRWGRTYENFSENTELVTQMGVASLNGMQWVDGMPDLSNPLAVLATPKAFLGDGGTIWGTTGNNIWNHGFGLDQGDMRMDEATVRALFLPPYKAAVDVGALSIMVSFSSWNGTKMHAEKHLLTDVLKGELGFKGFLISDFLGMDQVSPYYYEAMVTSINAGLDMNMGSYDPDRFISTVKKAVQSGDISMSRIDDAVWRILYVKFKMGLFENPMTDPSLLKLIGSTEHRALAREAVQKSLVLLKNEDHVLPLAKDTPTIYIAGVGADDIGMMCGGWTISWQGAMGNIEPGTTILQALEKTVSPGTTVKYDRAGNFDGTADIGIAVVGEQPYAEGVGDSFNLDLSSSDVDLIQIVKEHSKKTVVILVSGRPLVVTEQLGWMDALVAAWLPGTEGQGIVDVLFGDAPFTGKLPYTWPRWSEQLPFNFQDLPKESCDAPLFPFGYGLSTGDPSPAIPDCPAK
jgi:beta-glucosidase